MVLKSVSHSPTIGNGPMNITTLISNIDFSNIEFAQPFFLWLLVAIPILWLRFRGHSPAVIVWRSVILLLLIFGLVDPRLVAVTERTTRQENIFAFDLSKSVPASMRRWMAEAAQNGFTPREGDRTFVFGLEAKEAPNWREWLGDQPPQLESIQPERTNLEKLFNALLALPPGPRNVFLFTDGWETQGNLQRLFPAIAASGLKVFPVLPANPPKIANVAVAKLLAPNHGESGEPVTLKVVLENQSERQIDGTLSVLRNGQAVKSDTVKLRPGSHIFNYSSVLPDQALTSYRATFVPRDPALDAYSADNQAFAWVSVRSKAKVLLLNGRSGAGRNLEELLKRKGFEVTSRLAESPPPPAGFGVVIFNNVEREKFTANYLAAVEKHVADGNGFLMLGNEASFGPNEFRRTPIEPVLPVEPKEPKREERNRAVVLVIDKSGSMREDNRIVYAQEAAKAVARQLKDNDLIGVVGFDVSPFIVVEMDSVGRLRRSFDSQIDRLRPGGQTFFYPALVEAKRQLEKQTTGRKHIILLSDGETRGSQGELIDLVNVLKTEMKITVSAVAIGREADIPVMKRISQYGGGLFHHVIDPATLPQIVLQQLQEKPVDEPPPERDLTPLQEKNSEILAGFGGRAYPPIRGIMETDLKRGAQLDLFVVRENRKIPLLASWKYRRGKAAALTMDMEGQSSRSWIQWGGLQAFWDKMMDWLGPTREPIPNHELRVSVSGNQPVLDFYVYEESSSDSQFRYSISGRETKNGSLKKLARGHFQSILPISRPGDYQIEITEERNGRRLSYPKAGYTLPHELNVEMPQPRFNLNLLQQLASISAGEINPGSLKSSEKQELSKTYRTFREYLIAIAAVLFLLEVGFRKLILAEAD
jgi:Ca-activated chloride channel family protein